jgi:Phage tail tube protein
MPQYPGPTANLPGYARRSGRSGTVWESGRMRGEVQQVTWNLNIGQINVLIAGQWATENKPGGEERTGTFLIQDVDDYWQLRVYNFIVARRNGDRSAGYFPEFSILVKIDDIGAPRASTWQLDGCQLFQLASGFDQATELLTRQIPFAYRTERPVDTFYYGDSGIQVVQD